MRASSVLVITTFILSAPPIHAGDWPQFRGPRGDGFVESLQHPLDWGSEQNVAWKVIVPGAGWSSPVVAGQNVFLTTAVAPTPVKPKNMSAGTRDLRSMGLGARVGKDALKFEVHCLELATGKTKWTTLVAEQNPIISIHPSNTHATESPTTDGENVYVYFGTIGLVAGLDASGKLMWRKEVGAYPITAGLGPGSSPILSEGLLYVPCYNEENSFLLALNAKTGEQVWRGETLGSTSWATPMLWTNRMRTELVSCGGKTVTSFDPKSGKVLWSMSKLDSGFSASPGIDDARIYFGGGAPGSASILYAIKAGANGEIPLPAKDGKGDHVAWSGKRLAPGMSSPLVLGKELYVVNDFFNCHDTESGERLYRQRLPVAKTFVASPWAGGGMIFLLDEVGQTFVVEASRQFKLVRVNTLSDSDTFWSTPSVAGDSLLIRGVEHLYCVRR